MTRQIYLTGFHYHDSKAKSAKHETIRNLLLAAISYHDSEMNNTVRKMTAFFICFTVQAPPVGFE